MVSRLPRVPRLTLFSGPTCSLCEAAKSELAKVRQTRPFQLETINIHEAGQERWKRKEGDSQGTMGRADGLPSASGLGQEDDRSNDIGAGRPEETLILPFFPHTGPEALPDIYECYGIYTRVETDRVLGEDDEGDEEEWKAIPRCFNCGHEEHSVKECPFRLNRELIDLSRQYYQFSKGTIGTTNWERVHTAEGWRQTRLNWLEDFEPGVIRGRLLLEALGEGGDSEWLRNMAVWGYPKGWVGERDPREVVRERIWAEHGGAIELELDDSEPLVIHGDDEIEVVSFRYMFAKLTHEGGEKDACEDGEACCSLPPEEPQHDSPTQREPSESPSAPIRRWVTYPSSHFLSDLLPIHTGFTLPPIAGGSSNEPTFFERQPLSAKFNWDAWAASHVDPEPPPPPPDEPPPLPPEPQYAPPPMPAQQPPVYHPPPPPHPSVPVLTFPSEDPGECSDMDVSESDSE